MFFPSVLKSDKAIDIPTSFYTDRVIFLNSEITDETAMMIVSELLQLESISSDEDIVMYINSPGGSVSAGFAIYDTMQYVSCDVSTICVGMAASMASVLLAAGTKGKRFALPHSQILIHQPLGGVQGQATEIEIAAKHILDVRATVNGILSECTGRPVIEIASDTDRDNYMFADEAVKYGLIDRVKTRREEP